jgi:hypothetical protein
MSKPVARQQCLREGWCGAYCLRLSAVGMGRTRTSRARTTSPKNSSFGHPRGRFSTRTTSTIGYSFRSWPRPASAGYAARPTSYLRLAPHPKRGLDHLCERPDGTQLDSSDRGHLRPPDSRRQRVLCRSIGRVLAEEAKTSPRQSANPRAATRTGDPPGPPASCRRNWWRR